jgi:hypothetical protein
MATRIRAQPLFRHESPDGQRGSGQNDLVLEIRIGRSSLRQPHGSHGTRPPPSPQMQQYLGESK